MSVKDLIWVNVAQGIKRKEKNENEMQLYKNNVELAETFYFSLCDLRDLLLDTNFYTRAAVRENFKSRLTSFDIKTLTSSRVEKKRKEDEKMEKMTPEQRAKYELQRMRAGEIIS